MGDHEVRVVELAAALSLATDAGTGQPFEHALRTCLLSLWAAEALGLPAADRSVVLYTALLRFLGCTADASETAVLAGGDEIAFNAAMAPVVMADDREGLPHLLRHLGADLPLPRRAGRIAAALSDPGGKARSLSSHCEVGARLATRIGLPSEVTRALAHAYERWDGKGLPEGLAGDDVPVATRIAVAARDLDVWNASSGIEQGLGVLRHRRGRAYDPAVVDVFVAEGVPWLARLEQVDPWEAVLDAEPAPRVVAGDRLDDVLVAFADFSDIKSPWLRGHSRSVAELAASAAHAAGLGARDVESARRLGLVHDLGLVGVPTGVLDRRGPLSSEAWERVRLHPHLSERILSRCGGLGALARDAGSHHERVDGSGYHRGSVDASPLSQIVAAADVYDALCADRPHRPKINAADATDVLAKEADAGHLSRSAVDAVLTAAGQRPPTPNVERPMGLTEREVDVLRLIARGRSNKEAARDLGISTKTVGTHIEHIYAKASVSTRAGVTLFAMEQGLLAP